MIYIIFVVNFYIISGVVSGKTDYTFVQEEQMDFYLCSYCGVNL